MGVRQLEEFLGQADQKGFWIFSYGNLGGGFLGAFVGNSLFERTMPSLKLLGILLGIILGVMVTWKVKGLPIYKWALTYANFLLRRYLKVGLGDSIISAGLYYKSRAAKQAPFLLVATRDGKTVPILVHKGSGASTGSHAGLLDGLLLPTEHGPQNEPVSALIASPYKRREDVLGAIQLPENPSASSVVGAQHDPNYATYAEWDL